MHTCPDRHYALRGAACHSPGRGCHIVARYFVSLCLPYITACIACVCLMSPPHCHSPVTMRRCRNPRLFSALRPPHSPHANFSKFPPLLWCSCSHMLPVPSCSVDGALTHRKHCHFWQLRSLSCILFFCSVSWAQIFGGHTAMGAWGYLLPGRAGEVIAVGGAIIVPCLWPLGIAHRQMHVLRFAVVAFHATMCLAVSCTGCLYLNVCRLCPFSLHPGAVGSVMQVPSFTQHDCGICCC